MYSKYTFIVNGTEYQIDNTAFMDKKREDIYFETRQCPKCKKYNSFDAVKCDKCGTALSDNNIRIGKRIKRYILGLFIGAVAWGVIKGILTTFNRSPGIIITIILIALCLSFGRVVAGNKIITYEKAEEDYWQYRKKEVAKMQTNMSSFEETEKYALVTECSACGKKTEADSIFCSNCGAVIKSK